MGSITNICSIISYGADGRSVEIECHLANSLPTIVIVGAANRTVDEARERIRGAFTTAGLTLPRKRISINLAPADMPKDSSSLDLPIATAILYKAGMISQPPGMHEAVIGELGLDGRVRPVRGIIGKLLAGRREGIKQFYLPVGNVFQAQAVPGVSITPVEDLRQLVELFCGRSGAKPIKAPVTRPITAGTTSQLYAANNQPAVRLHDIAGQPQAKRALQIAAAGGHNILLSGPPGTGKSMLAKALVSLLPELSHEEILEVTQLHSLGSPQYDQLVTARPFRAPHHSASHASVVGGGSSIRPGEISLAHRGVLLFDELPEFSRATIEALRQPLEDKQITIARARENITYPANFIFAATANPCPCGYYAMSATATRSTLCDCTASALAAYRAKLSGPLMDRIDLSVTVDTVEYQNLLTPNLDNNDDTASIVRLVLEARERQIRRFSTPVTLNADMTAADIRRYAQPNAKAKAILDLSAHNIGLSARGYMRCLRVARTIADLADAAEIGPTHVSEALRFRPQAQAMTLATVSQ